MQSEQTGTLLHMSFYKGWLGSAVEGLHHRGGPGLLRLEFLKLLPFELLNLSQLSSQKNVVQLQLSSSLSCILKLGYEVSLEEYIQIRGSTLRLLLRFVLLQLLFPQFDELIPTVEVTP